MSKQKEYMDLIDEIVDFLKKSPTKYHFVSNAKRLFKKYKIKEILHIDKDNLDIPDKGFIAIDRSTIIAFELGTSDKSLIISSSIERKILKLDDSEKINDDGIIQYEISKKEGDDNENSELWNMFDYQLAGEILVKKNVASKQHLFDSETPIGIVENNVAFLSLPETSIQSYLEFTHNISYQEINLIEKNLYLIPNSQTWDNVYVGPSNSLVNISNLSTLGASFIALKAFLTSTSKNSYNKFVVITPNEDSITSSLIISYINLILSTKKASLNNESLVFNIGGIESLWASHFPSSSNAKFLSKGIVIQNCHHNEIILDKLAVFGIPVYFADDQEIKYSVKQDQLLIVDEILPIKISLPLFNYKEMTETASVSDIFNFYNSLYEICLI